MYNVQRKYTVDPSITHKLHWIAHLYYNVVQYTRAQVSANYHWKQCL